MAKVIVSAKVDPAVKAAVERVARGVKERRSGSSMIEILLIEALGYRREKLKIK